MNGGGGGVQRATATTTHSLRMERSRLLQQLAAAQADNDRMLKETAAQEAHAATGGVITTRQMQHTLLEYEQALQVTHARERERERGPGGLAREVATPLPSNHPRHDHVTPFHYATQCHAGRDTRSPYPHAAAAVVIT
jgi:hypothetical protein